MADAKISELNQLTTVVQNDLLVIVDTSASETKKLAVGDLLQADNINASGTPSVNTYLRGDNSWAAVPTGSGGGADTFLELTDTPATYTGYANALVRVNSSADALEFVTGSVTAYEYVHVNETQPSGTAGGTFTAGSWQTRTLNTEVSDAGNNIYISGSVITLQPGTYIAKISCPGYSVNRHQARLFDTLTSSVVLNGTPMYAYTNGSTNYGENRSEIVGKFTISVASTLIIQHQCESTKTTTGFGFPSLMGEEIYTVAEFWKEVSVSSGESSGTDVHNELTGLQGGTTNEYYHLTNAQQADLTDGDNCSIHKHDDRYSSGSHTHDASAINAGTLSTDRYSAYNDLVAENKIGIEDNQVPSGSHTHAGMGVGTVTSVGLTATPTSVFNTSGTITSSGNIDLSLDNQNANLTLSSPDGSAGQPSFRSLVIQDLPVGVLSSQVPSGTHTHDAGNINAGTLSTDRYSAYADLVAESKIGSGNTQLASGSHAHDDRYASGTHTHDASAINAGTLSTDRYSAYTDLVAESKIGSGNGQVPSGSHTHAYGVGTVTSVTLTATPAAIFNVSGTITSSGALDLSLDNQTTNKVLASPSGSTGQPSFRALASQDLPVGSASSQVASGTHTHDASNINAGTLSTDRYSAYADLVAESKIGVGNDQVASGSHIHDSRYYTETELQTSGSAQVNFGNVTSRTGLTDCGIMFVIGDGTNVITTGTKGDIEIPGTMIIESARVFSNGVTGSIVIDLWQDTYANFPPTSADSITASAKPTLSTSVKSEDTTLTDWTKTLTKNNILRVNVDSVTSVTQVTLSLIGKKVLS